VLRKVEILKRNYDMNVGIIGYGSMGKMLLQKISETGKVNHDKLFVSNRTLSKIEASPDKYVISESNTSLAMSSDIIFICTRPADLLPVLEEIKIFIGFVATIIRNRIYTLLKDEEQRIEKKQNYMTVPDALRELEKIEMVRLTDNRYRLDHAVTAVQKTVLKAFNIDEHLIKHYSEEISRMLKEEK